MVAGRRGCLAPVNERSAARDGEPGRLPGACGTIHGSATVHEVSSGVSADHSGVRPPRWIPALERALPSPPRSGGPDEIFERLALDAARSVGGSRPVDRDLQEGLTLVLADTLAEPRVTKLGVLSCSGEVRRRLAIALALRRIESERPDVLANPLSPPLVVVGLPRSGTTALQEALAAQPGIRTTSFWQLSNAPSVRRRSVDEVMAIARSAVFSTFAHLAMPALRRLHPLGATTPQETTQAMAHSPHHAVRAPLPTYRAWLASRDPVPDLLRLRMLLQVLAWDGADNETPRRRWVIKSPFHLHDLAALSSVFPGATVVWTHRDPAAALGSWCQLVETVQSVTMLHRNPAEIGPEWLSSWADGIRSASQFRKSNPQLFIDVDQSRLAADPAGEIAAVLEQIGMDPAPASMTTPPPGGLLSAARAGLTPHRARPQRANLARYGLDPEEVVQRLAPPEPPPPTGGGRPTAIFRARGVAAQAVRPPSRKNPPDPTDLREGGLTLG